MGYISRVLLPRVKVTLPQYMGSAVRPVYLGMPPLPIGGLRNAAATGINGISVGSIRTTTEPNGTTDIKGSVKRGGKRFAIAKPNVVAKVAKGNNSKGVQKTKKAGTSRSNMVKKQKRKGGRFTK